MGQEKSPATSWLILGATFILLLFVYAYVERFTRLMFSYGLDAFVSTVLGGGGAIFLVVGIVKEIIYRFRK